MRRKPETRSLLTLFATQKNITKTSNRLKPLSGEENKKYIEEKLQGVKMKVKKQTVQHTAHKRRGIKLIVN